MTGRHPSILLVAYHFPPHSGSSGFLRTLKFARYLPEHGWDTAVLSVTPGAYERLDYAPLKDVPERVPVKRALAFDTKRHLSLRGRYPRWLGLPDRWVSWVFSAVPAGIRLMRKRSVNVLFTTYPIATAVLIGGIIHRLTRVPWVVDFRDAMTEPYFPSDPATRSVYTKIERDAAARASLLVFTTESSRKMYVDRYPGRDPSSLVVVSNGYDEDDFIGLPPGPAPALHERPVRMLHSGLLDPQERNPRPFFEALASLKKSNVLTGRQIRVDFRAAGAEGLYGPMLSELGIDDIVRLLPPMPYRKSLEDASAAYDCLLLFQGQTVDHQIPAKTYEYLRLGKPVLAVVSLAGDTAALLRSCTGATLVSNVDGDAIAATLPGFVQAVRSQTHPTPEPDQVTRFSRRSLAGELARHLNGLMADGSNAKISTANGT
jgi:glycosyltransferase involved in cell wall biosynthesis